MALMPLVWKLSNILLSKMSRIEIDNKQLIILNKDKINFKYFSFEEFKKISDINLDIAVLYSNYNLSINISLINGFLNELSKNNYLGNVVYLEVPGGAFEIPVFCKRIINAHRPLIVLSAGCIIKGDTKHFDFLSSCVTNALMNLSVETKTPILNGILTVENNLQAIERAGLKLNKGKEFANAALKILDFSQYFNE